MRRQAPPRRVRSRVAATVLVAILAASAAGCGGELSKSEYEEKVQAEWADVQAAFQATAVGSDLDDLAEATKRAQDELRQSADDLDDVDAPKAVEELNEELAQALRGYADDLDAVVEAAEEGDARRITEFNRRISTNRWILQIREIAEQMTAKGYSLGPLAED